MIPVFTFSPDSELYIDGYGLNFSQIRYMAISLCERKMEIQVTFQLEFSFQIAPLEEKSTQPTSLPESSLSLFPLTLNVAFIYLRSWVHKGI